MAEFWNPTGLLGDPRVLVDEAAKDGPAPDLLLGQVGHGVIGPGRAKLAAAMGPSSVVVGLVTGQDRPQVSFADDQHPVDDLGPGGEHEPLRKGIRPRAPGRDLYRFDAGAGQDGVEGHGELPGPVAEQEPEVRGAVAEIHQKIADLLCGPRPVRVRGDAGDMDVARPAFITKKQYKR